MWNVWWMFTLLSNSMIVVIFFLISLHIFLKLCLNLGWWFCTSCNIYHVSCCSSGDIVTFFLRSFFFSQGTLWKGCLSFIVGWTDKQMCNGVRNGRLPTMVYFSVLKGCGKLSLPYSYIFSSSLYIMRGDWWTQQQGEKEQLPSTTKLSVLKSKMFSGQVNHFRKGLETSFSAIVLSGVQFNSFREKGTVALDIFL